MAIAKNARVFVAGHRPSINPAAPFSAPLSAPRLHPPSHPLPRRTRTSSTADAVTRILSPRTAQIRLRRRRESRRHPRQQHPACLHSSTRISSSKTISSTAPTKHAVRKLLFLGSSCIYPKLAPRNRSRKNTSLTGPLEPSNEMVCHRQNRRPQTLRSPPSPIQLRLHLRHASTNHIRPPATTTIS